MENLNTPGLEASIAAIQQRIYTCLTRKRRLFYALNDARDETITAIRIVKEAVDTGKLILQEPVEVYRWKDPYFFNTRYAVIVTPQGIAELRSSHYDSEHCTLEESTSRYTPSEPKDVLCCPEETAASDEYDGVILGIAHLLSRKNPTQPA